MMRALRSLACLALLSSAIALPSRAQAPANSIAQDYQTPAGPTAREKREAAKAYLAGGHAIEQKDSRAAFEHFTRAAQLDPANPDYGNAAQVAKAHFVTDLVQQAEQARIQGKTDIVRARLTEAMALDPTNPLVQQHATDTLDEEPSIQTENISAEAADVIRLEPSAGVHSFHVRTDGVSLIRQVLTAYGIQPTLDASVKHQPVRFDADDIDYRQAARLIGLATNAFLVPLDPHRVLVALDTRANRTEFERQMVETIYLPGLTEQEFVDTTNVARNIMQLRQVSTFLTAHTMTVRGTESSLALLNRTLKGLMEGRPQVLLEVKVYEIQRSRSVNAGVQMPQQFNAFNLNSEIQNVIGQNQSLIQQIISSGLANANDIEAIAAILIASGQVSDSILTQPFALFGGGLTTTGITLGSPTLNLALNSSESRALDQVQLRLGDQEAGSIVSGTHYPITQSSYSNLTSTSSIPGLTTAGLSSQLTALGLNGSSATTAALPQVQYQDLGLNMKVTPYIHRDESVSLKVDLKIDALAGTSLNGIPVLTNRQFTALLDLQNGKSAVVTSNLSTQEMRAVSGLPGLSEIPGLGSTTDKDIQKSNDELVVLITPHIVRLPHSTGVSPLLTLPLHD